MSVLKNEKQGYALRRVCLLRGVSGCCRRPSTIDRSAMRKKGCAAANQRNERWRNARQPEMGTIGFKLAMDVWRGGLPLKEGEGCGLVCWRRLGQGN